MLAILSTITFDPVGYLELDVEPVSQMNERRRRVNRIATLDGGVVFSEGGYTDADRTFELQWYVKNAEEEGYIARLVETYTRLRLAIYDAVYLVAPEVYRPGLEQSRITLLVQERLTT